MIVYAVYVLSDDGRIILSENFHTVERISDDVLLGGVFTAIQKITRMVTKTDAEISSIKLDGLSYHIRSFGLIRVILVTEVPKNPEEIMQVLGFRFINEYGNVLMQADYNLNVFDQFRETIQEVIPQETIIDESEMIKPNIKLGTGEIFNLPIHLQNTALALVSLVKGTIENIAQETGDNLSDTERNLNSLQKMGFVGIKQTKGITTYFCSV